jgi:hypothetical protein
LNEEGKLATIYHFFSNSSCLVSPDFAGEAEKRSPWVAENEPDNSRVGFSRECSGPLIRPPLILQKHVQWWGWNFWIACFPFTKHPESLPLHRRDKGFMEAKRRKKYFGNGLFLLATGAFTGQPVSGQSLIIDSRQQGNFPSLQTMFVLCVVISTLLVAAGILLYFLYRQKAVIHRFQSRNQSLNSKCRRLEESNHAKDKFFTIVSHDLKTPLNSLQSLLMLLNMEAENLHPGGIDRADQRTGSKSCQQH